jgi:hypothetical protein
VRPLAAAIPHGPPSGRWSIRRVANHLRQCRELDGGRRLHSRDRASHRLCATEAASTSLANLALVADCSHLGQDPSTAYPQSVRHQVFVRGWATTRTWYRTRCSR